MFNSSGIEGVLNDFLLWGFVALAIGIIYVGVTKKKIGLAATMGGIALIAVIVAGMGALVGTDTGKNILSTILNLG